MKPSRALAAAFALALAGPATAGPPLGREAPVLKARPASAATGLKAGQTRLANGALAYRPASHAAGPAPLVVLLHGAGGYPPNFLKAMEPVADRLGLILLQPRSRAATWDFIAKLGAGQDPWSGANDARRLDESLGDLFGRVAIDPRRVVLLGFSDGASYALSLGAANPQLFSAVVALSPGMFAPPRRIDRNQRIFIAHGRSDSVLPFTGAKGMADALRQGGGSVRFRPFDGGHRMDPDSLAEALDWALGSGGR